MNFSILFKAAMTSILRNKVRSFLTTLGVVIGVLSVILLTSIGNGLTVVVQEQFQNLGSNVLVVTPGELVNEEGEFNQDQAALSFVNSKLTQADARTILVAGYPIEATAPLMGGNGEARNAVGKKTGMIVATTPDYALIRNTTTAKGHFLTDSDVAGKRKVVVIGGKIADKLFPNTNPIGESITINNIRFEVIGVADKISSGSFGGPDIDSILYIPISVGPSVGIEKIMEIVVRVVNEKEISRATTLINNTLNKRLKEKEFAVTDQNDILKTIQTILGALTIGLTGIAAISLIVGGIGIMNIMLVAVSERTREIGLRKALGATPGNIMTQFLIESAVLSTLGGLMGIIIGVLGTLAIRPFFPATPALSSIFLAFTVSLITGIVFGVFPARKAAALNPIDALRYE